MVGPSTAWSWLPIGADLPRVQSAAPLTATRGGGLGSYDSNSVQTRDGDGLHEHMPKDS